MAPPHVPLSTTAPLQNQRRSNIYTASASPFRDFSSPARALPSEPDASPPAKRRLHRLGPCLPFLSLPLPPSLSLSRRRGVPVQPHRRRFPARSAGWATTPPGSAGVGPGRGLCLSPAMARRGQPHRWPSACLPPPLPPPPAPRVLICYKCYRKPYLPLLHETLAAGSAQVSSRSFILVWYAYVSSDFTCPRVRSYGRWVDLEYQQSDHLPVHSSCVAIHTPCLELIFLLKLCICTSILFSWISSTACSITAATRRTIGMTTYFAGTCLFGAFFCTTAI